MKKQLQKMFKDPKIYLLLAIIIVGLLLPNLLGSNSYFTEGMTSGSNYELTPAEFKEKSKNASLFTFFYAPWCGHCKKMKPDWIKASQKVNTGSTMKMVMVDLGDSNNKDQEQLRNEYGIQGYPTIMDIVNGKKGSEYSGDRTPDALVKYASGM